MLTRRATILLLAVAALLVPASAVAPAAVAPAYTLAHGTGAAAGTFVARPLAPDTILAVDVKQAGANIEFSPVPASYPADCVTIAAGVSCSSATLGSKLDLGGGTLEVAVHGVTGPTLAFTGSADSDTIKVDGGASTIEIAPGAGNDSVTLDGAIGTITQPATGDPDPGDDRWTLSIPDPTGPSPVPTLDLGGGDDNAITNPRGLVLAGGAGADTLIGQGTLDGGSGDDVLEPLLPTQAVDGGPDADLLSYVRVGSALTMTRADATHWRVNQASTETPRVANIERIAGGDAGDTITGYSGPDTILGGGGDDTIDGRGGGDDLDGGPEGSLGNVVTYANLPNGPSGPIPVTIDLGAGTATSSLGTDALRGFRRVATGAGNDVVVGTPAAESFSVGDGADHVDAGAGDDRISGGLGDDVLRGGRGTDQIAGNDGLDTATYDERGASEPVVVTLASPGGDGAQGENDTLTDIENVTGGASNDTLVGDNRPNVLLGGPGVDAIDGGAGDDTLHGGDNRDVITGGPGADQLFGEGDDDSIDAYDGVRDTVSCGESADDDAHVDALDATDGTCEYAARGSVPALIDADRDGAVAPPAGGPATAGYDCNDRNPAVHPGAVDIVDNGIDEDCDGLDKARSYVEIEFELEFSLPTAREQKSGRKGRRVKRFVVTPHQGGTTVEVLCTAPRRAKVKCPFKRVKKTGTTTSDLNFTKLFRKRLLGPKTTIELRISAAGYNGRVRRYALTSSGSVRETLLCQKLGAKKPGKCPAGEE